MAENPLQHGKLCTNLCPKIIYRFFQFDCKYTTLHRYRRTRLMILRQLQQQYDVEVQAFRY